MLIPAGLRVGEDGLDKLSPIEVALSLEFFLLILEAREPKKLLGRGMASQFLPGSVDGTMKIEEDMLKEGYFMVTLSGKNGTMTCNQS
jgi:hypothetical protein